MDSIRKLKKQILKEELRRRRKTNKRLFLIPAVLLLLLAAVGGWYYTRAENLAESKFQQAEELLSEKKYAQAARAFEALSQKYPAFQRADEALFRLGELQHFYLRQDQEALLTFLLVEKNYPGSSFSLKAQRRAADIYMERLEDYGRAVIAYQKLLDQGVAEGDQLQYRIGEAYFRLNNFEQARIEWQTLLEQYPDTALAPEIGYRIAVSWSLQGEHAEAVRGFREVFATWPDHSYGLEARFGLAALREEQEQLVTALEILQSLRGSYPRPEVLEQRIEQVQERIAKKKKAI